MPIEITGHSSTQLPTASEGATLQVGRNELKSPQHDSGRPSSLDTITVTETAAQMQRLDEAIARVPVVDTQRVESVQNALDTGAYHFDPQRVADGLLRFESAVHRS